MSYLYLIVVVFLTFGLTVGEDSLNCYTKWISGYRLASGRAKKIIHSVSLKSCEEECIRSIGCAAFAYGLVNTFIYVFLNAKVLQFSTINELQKIWVD